MKLMGVEILMRLLVMMILIPVCLGLRKWKRWRRCVSSMSFDVIWRMDVVVVLWRGWRRFRSAKRWTEVRSGGKRMTCCSGSDDEEPHEQEGGNRWW